MNLKLFILAFAVLLFGGIWLSWQRLGQPQPDKQPKISVTPSNHDFGRVQYGNIVQAEFVIKNAGESDLVITRLSTSCGCTTATLPDRSAALAAGQSLSIQAGQSERLMVAFDPAVHKDDTDLGQVRRVVYINSNDPVTAEAQVTIEAEVYK